MTDHDTMQKIPRARLWRMVHDERAALASDLARLDDQEWETPSLCDGLSVREVLAHLTSGASLSWARWMIGVIKCRFDFDKNVTMRLSEQLGTSPSETLGRFNRAITSTSGAIPLKAMLGEVVVHAEDIRRPLGIRRIYPAEMIRLLADYYRGTDFVVVARKRVADLRLVAHDGPFAAGEGALVSGTTLALTMAMTGRAIYCDELEEGGVETLRQRCHTM